MIFKYFLNNKAKTNLCYWNYTTVLPSSFLGHIARTKKEVFLCKNLVYFSQRPSWYIKIFFWNSYSFTISSNLFCIVLIKLFMHHSIILFFRKDLQFPMTYQKMDYLLKMMKMNIKRGQCFTMVVCLFFLFNMLF